MASLSYLRSERTKYSNLKDKVVDAVGYLAKAIDSLDPAANKIGELFSIDEVNADLKIVFKNREDLITRKNFLSSEVISAIDAEIASLDRQIQAELERLAREAARRRARSRSSSKTVSKK